MSDKYNQMKKSLVEDNKCEYTKLSSKILGDGLMKPEEFTHKVYMEILECEITKLNKENDELKIKYIDFKNLKEENEKLQQYNEWGKSATLKWNESLIVIEKLKQEKQELKDEIVSLHETDEWELYKKPCNHCATINMPCVCRFRDL